MKKNNKKKLKKKKKKMGWEVQQYGKIGSLKVYSTQIKQNSAFVFFCFFVTKVWYDALIFVRNFYNPDEKDYV